LLKEASTPIGNSSFQEESNLSNPAGNEVRAKLGSAGLPNSSEDDNMGSATETKDMNDKTMRSSLDPRFTFERYVVGPFNTYACGVALSIAKKPARKYNPLSIYSEVGQGKTHLMVAVGHEVLTRAKSKRVLFVTSEEFTNEMINAIRFDGMDDFRNRYRMLDVLLVDDVHFFWTRNGLSRSFCKLL